MQAVVSNPNVQPIARRRVFSRWIFRQEKGQSIIEFIFLLPIFVLLMILVVQFTTTYFGVFGDFAKVRNEALKNARKAETTRMACFEERDTHSFLLGFGNSKSKETRVRLWAVASGSSTCR